MNPLRSVCSLSAAWAFSLGIAALVVPACNGSGPQQSTPDQGAVDEGAPDQRLPDQGAPLNPPDHATVLDLPGKSVAWAVTTLQPDGRILIAGTSTNPTEKTLLARFLPGGALDKTFGAGTGSVVTDLVIAGKSQPNGARAIAVQPADGKILTAGYVLADSGFRFSTLRYLPDGALDVSFGTGGLVSFDLNPDFVVQGDPSSDVAQSISIQADGKIVVGGSSAVHHAMSGFYWSDVALVRLLKDGSVDASFGKGGVVIQNLGGSAFFTSTAILGDGRIVAGGHATPAADTDLLLARFLPNGQLDASMGKGGFALQNLGGDERGFSLSVLADGKYLLAGQTTIVTATDGGMVPDMGAPPTAFAVARFDTSGHLDAAFGSGGIVKTVFPHEGSVARGLALSDGGFLLAGYAPGEGGHLTFALARYHSDGSLDPCAGTGGLANFVVTAGTSSVGTSIALQPDGSPVLAGYANDIAAIVRIDDKIFRHTASCH